MSESAYKAKVIPLVMEKHPNADALSIVRADGFQCVVNTEAWVGRDKMEKIGVKTPNNLFTNYTKEIVEELTNGATFESASHIREGVVIRPERERFSLKLGGRLILKSVSNAYLEKKGK